MKKVSKIKLSLGPRPKITIPWLIPSSTHQTLLNSGLTSKDSNHHDDLPISDNIDEFASNEKRNKVFHSHQKPIKEQSFNYAPIGPVAGSFIPISPPTTSEKDCKIDNPKASFLHKVSFTSSDPSFSNTKEKKEYIKPFKKKRKVDSIGNSKQIKPVIQKYTQVIFKSEIPMKYSKSKLSIKKTIFQSEKTGEKKLMNNTSKLRRSQTKAKKVKEKLKKAPEIIIMDFGNLERIRGSKILSQNGLKNKLLSIKQFSTGSKVNANTNGNVLYCYLEYIRIP